MQVRFVSSNTITPALHKELLYFLNCVPIVNHAVIDHNAAIVITFNTTDINVIESYDLHKHLTLIVRKHTLTDTQLNMTDPHSGPPALIHLQFSVLAGHHTDLEQILIGKIQSYHYNPEGTILHVYCNHKDLQRIIDLKHTIGTRIRLGQCFSFEKLPKQTVLYDPT